MSEHAAMSFDRLEPGMQVALHRAWESARAGSLGIGAALVDDAGNVVATGRNRINETDPGDDVLAGSTMAHAELNALAKIPYRAFDSLALYTTLQPCVQCLGAIRLAPVTSVQVLAPDPLFAGVERMEHLTPFIASRWPAISQRPVDEWATFGLLYPTRHALGHPRIESKWTAALPTVTELARRTTHDEAFHAAQSVTLAAQIIWGALAECVPEIERWVSSPAPE